MDPASEAKAVSVVLGQHPEGVWRIAGSDCFLHLSTAVILRIARKGASGNFSFPLEIGDCLLLAGEFRRFLTKEGENRFVSFSEFLWETISLSLSRDVTQAPWPVIQIRVSFR